VNLEFVRPWPILLVDDNSEIIATTAHYLRARGLEVAGDLPDVRADVVKLQQVMTNLLANAIKYTDRGSVFIRARKADEGHVVIDVEDTGIGIRPEALERVWQPFEQDESITSLSKDQLRRIFSGQARDWSEVGGGPQPITVISRPEGTGTRTMFEAIVLGGDRFVYSSFEQESSAELQGTLLHTVGAISYLALSYRRRELAVFALDGTLPSSENIESGAYPIWSYEHLYTRGPATGEVREFIDFVSPRPRKAIRSLLSGSSFRAR
jgi:CheY-like chemotaxis protein